MAPDGYILRSYREVWREQLKAEAGADEVTRLPMRKIGAAMGTYVITGKHHREAAAYMQEQLDKGISLAEEIVLASTIEEEFQVAVETEYERIYRDE